MPVAGPRDEALRGSLYFSPHEDDVLLSCPGRLLAERAQGASVVVAVAFSSDGSPEAGAAGRALTEMGIELAGLGFAPAPERNEFYRSFTRACFERHSEDAQLLPELSERIRELVLRTRARHVYLPLGAAGHVDHKLCHEAGLRALHDATGRDVFFYEERPQAFVPGAIRARMSELGARLPPVAADIHDDPSTARAFLSFALAPFLRTERLPAAERVRAARRFARGLRAGRAWRPTRAFGLRLQPVLETLSAAELHRMLGALSGTEARIAQLFGTRQRLEAQARRYSERLGRAPYTERYWLMLPPRDEGGLVSVPLADIVGAG